MILNLIIGSLNNQSYEIDDVINFLNECKDKGATHFSHEISSDPSWPVDRFNCLKCPTKLEIAQDDLKIAQRRVRELKSKIKKHEI